MILIGQYDSSFVRRVGIALTLYGIEFEHRPWSVFGDADKIREFNPLTRVPTLVLNDGEVLTDCMAILLWLDRSMAKDMSLMPQTEPDATHCLSVMALAGGLADKAVALFYEQQLHDQRSDLWKQRCEAQMTGAAARLEADRASRGTPYWFGTTISHADIAVAASLLHARVSHPELLPDDAYPALAAHCAAMEALPVFKAVYQEFIPPS